MKKNKKSRSIWALLARYYLLFTGLLALLFLGLFLVWDQYLGLLLSAPDPQGLTGSPAFLRGEYGSVDTLRYLGAKGGFAVYDGSGTWLYTSTDALPLLDEGELACVPLYASGEYVRLTGFTSPQGEQRWLLTRESYDEDQHPRTQVAVLDDSFRLLEGAVTPVKEQYTSRELDYLTNQWSEEYELGRMETVGGQGQPLTLIFLLPKYFDYQAAAQKAGRVWLLAIPLYFGVALAFILLLNRHFRQPLARLDQAIRKLGAGEAVSAASCGGPAEIEALGRSFDAMAARLAQSQAETRRLEEQRIQMLTDISHDLKTPITVIAGYADAIRDGKISPEELSRYLETISRKAKGLSGLIQQFYQYSQTQHPDFRLERVRVDLCEYLREYLADKYGELDLAGFALEVEIPESRPYPVRLDPFQLGRALDNLISNALRHNPPGTLLRVTLSPGEEGARLLLEDNGRGIPPQLRQDLFTPFAVGDQSRSSGGSGLGLAITLKILQAHGWAIRLLPREEGQGTAFEIQIPPSL